MILWVAVGVGLVTTIAAIGLGFAMWRADRRARRNLYRALGISEDVIDRLMTRRGDVTAELAVLRGSSNAPRGADTSTQASASGEGSRAEPDAAPQWAAIGARPAGPAEARAVAALEARPIDPAAAPETIPKRRNRGWRHADDPTNWPR
jgi:hypothetical protein